MLDQRRTGEGMTGQIPEAVIEHIVKTSEFIGSVDERLKHGNERMERMETQLKDKACTGDVQRLEDKVLKHHNIIKDPDEECPAARRTLEKHEKENHPSREEEIGKKVLGVLRWVKENPGKGGILSITGIIITIIGYIYFG